MAIVKKTKGGVYEGSKCWGCHYSLNKERVCPWADHLEPRTDWQAIHTQTSSGGDSYHVISCPGFLSDREYEERIENETTEDEELPDMRQPYYEEN